MPSPTNRLMYTPHPDRIRFPSILPAHIANAPDHTYMIDYVNLVDMHDTITELATLLSDVDPRCVLFFATGGYPVALPILHRLCDSGHARLTSGSVFQMFPWLAWPGHIDGLSAMEYMARELEPFLRAEAYGKGPIVAIDTTNVGNAVNAAVKAILAACERAGLETKIPTLSASLMAQSKRVKTIVVSSYLQTMIPVGASISFVRLDIVRLKQSETAAYYASRLTRAYLISASATGWSISSSRKTSQSLSVLSPSEKLWV